MNRTVVLPIFLIALATCNAAAETTYPGHDALEAAARYSAETNGQALLVMRGGDVLLERYAEGFTAETPHLLASGTKSFWGVAAMAAVEDGWLTLDEKVADTLPEWRDDPRKAAITVRQLLTLSSGLDPGTEALRGPRIQDKFAHAVTLDSKYDPGARFEYGPGPYYVLGELMKRKLGGESPLAYLKRRILDPIGMPVATWRSDRAGNPMMPAGAALTARAWARFGRLIAQSGTWEGATILDPERLRACFAPSAVNPAYGLTWWLGRTEGAAQPDIYMAAGAGKQRLYVIPRLDLVVVRFGKPSRFDDARFLQLLIESSTRLDAEPAER